MHRRAGGLCGVVVGLLAVTASLVFAGAARPLPSCNLGQITKFGDPSLSAPSPTYPGSTITSTGGSWSSCGESITGYYKEWLRDGSVVSGPTFVASSPGPFAYLLPPPGGRARAPRPAGPPSREPPPAPPPRPRRPQPRPSRPRPLPPPPPPPPPPPRRRPPHRRCSSTSTRVSSRRSQTTPETSSA